nr:MAG TPA: hypothetical protein [Caudoviricetes sp.]
MERILNIEDEPAKKTPTQSKTINYFRIEFKAPTGANMEVLLDKAHAALPDVNDRVFSSEGQEFKSCHVRQTKSEGHYVHVTAVTPGEPSSAVPNKTNVREVDVQLVAPPADGNYMDSDMFFLVKGNHMLFSSSGLPVSKAKEYIKALLEKTGNADDEIKFSIQKMANVDKLRLIRQGVSEISLGCNISPATFQYEERTTVRTFLMGHVLDGFRAFFAKDPRFREIAEQENVTAEVTFKFNRARKGGENGKARMQTLSEKLIAEDDDGFRIITYGGEKISYEEVCIKKAIKFKKFGKSVQYEDVWNSMKEYLSELQRTGVLEQ